jgi:hypothetical protein
MQSRYLAIVYPISSKNLRSPSSTGRVVSLLWAVVLLSSLPVFLVHGLSPKPDQTSQCQFLKQQSVPWVGQVVSDQVTYQVKALLTKANNVRQFLPSNSASTELVVINEWYREGHSRGQAIVFSCYI